MYYRYHGDPGIQWETVCSNPKVWSRVIWDVTAVGWLLDGDFMLDCLKPSPIPTYEGVYAFDKNRHLIRYVYHINRDALMTDLVEALTF